VTRRLIPLLVVATISLLGARTASAQQHLGQLEPSYLLDGGAVPFVWMAIGTGLVLDHFASPRSNPLWFDEDEGGLSSRQAGELPGWVISGGATTMGVLIALDDSPSRWFHVKGFLESVAVTALVNRLAKLTFGRHRPDYDPALDDSDNQHKSFPSGHASKSAAALMYVGLYLHAHVLGGEPWNLAVYAGLIATEVAISAERVYRHRHHVSDVIAGSLLGMTSSVVFFLWQEQRYRRARAHELPPPAEAPPLPAIDGPSVAWAWTF
jgi:hypothetical protein